MPFQAAGAPWLMLTLSFSQLTSVNAASTAPMPLGTLQAAGGQRMHKRAELCLAGTQSGQLARPCLVCARSMVFPHVPAACLLMLTK